jgi:hypothetical protein
MNRIREYGKQYQVLISPIQQYNTGFEFILGSWSDETLKGFQVETYDSYNKAEYRAFMFPDINWVQLSEFHKDGFKYLKTQMKKTIKYTGFDNIRVISKLMTPSETKNTMFERIMKYQKKNDDFRLAYHMNDIISFTITNSYSSVLKKLSLNLIKNSRLNIKTVSEKNKIIRLIGKTDIGTTYEIVLIPDLVYNSMYNKTIKNINELQKIIDMQNKIDSIYF